MLGIPETIAAETAAQETRHSWLAELLAREGADYERTESALSAWMEQTASEAWPELENVGRILREASGLYLEREALQALAEKRPGLMRNIPIPEIPGEAVSLGAAEVMYVDQKEIKAARQMLEMLESGMLKPTALLEEK